ncbi:MAG TPA: S9 family peptidase, partial [Vicinamibacterales bacterium]|nr:S9 family peptidase [Vicinamibacterales bacterium]
RQARGRALTIEDYYRVQTIGATAFSPDAKWVSFTVSTRVEADNGTRTAVFIVPADGAAAPRAILHDGKDVTNPSWAAQGRLEYTIASQVWSVDPSRPSDPPTSVTRAPSSGGRGGAARVVSPDGMWVATLVDIPPPPHEVFPSRQTEFERRHAERFQGAIFDWMLFQRDGQPFPAPNLSARPAQAIQLRPPAGGGPRTIFGMAQDLRPTGLTWSPDSRLIAFTADPVWRDETKYDRPDIFTVDVNGDAFTRLTDDGYVYGDVRFSPDGKFLSYSRTIGTQLIVDQKLNHGGSDDLYIRPVAGGTPINLTQKFDLDPGAAQWSPDSKYLYFTAAKGGEQHLFRVAASGGAVEQVTKGERRINGLFYDATMTKIAYTVGLIDRPADLYVANIDGSGERRLTDVNRTLTDDVAFSPSDRLTWKSADGTPIEGWLTYPYGYAANASPYPLIVMSHGGPHASTGYAFDFKKQYVAANGYFVLDTNFRSSTGYGDAFKWATWGAWGDKDGQDVIAGIDYVLGRYPIDRARVGHIGHSYGGFMSNWLITQYPDRFAAAITGAGITNWISDYGTADIFRTKETEFFGPPWDRAARDRMIRQSPLTYADRVRTPTLFVHGEVDQRVPYEEGEQMYFALKRRGVPAKMIQYKGQPHGIAGHWNNVHRMINELAWWTTWLKGQRQ